MIPDTALSSSLHFGSHIKSFSSGSRGAAVSSASPASLPPQKFDVAYSPGNDSIRLLGASRPRDWPTRQQAQKYLSIMLASVGRLQHLVEPKITNQRLTETFSTQPRDHTTLATWYVELLLVFAIGQLLEGETRSIHDQPPGYAYFQQAMDLLPNACTLQNEGTLGVEIMALATFYLQCSDRKDDAYVNVKIPRC